MSLNMKDALVALVKKREQMAAIQGQPVHVTSQLTSANSKRRNDARIQNLQLALDQLMVRADAMTPGSEELEIAVRRGDSLNLELQRRTIARAEALEK